ncbi:MAG: hypothetical protein EXR66_05195 [Dehalococcoidia bacterium]|nr:hypothetical protein [Dehalococcoidia bacterium]
MARWQPVVFGFGATALASLVYLWLLQPPINLRLAVPLLGVGLVLGLLQGWQTRLYWEGRELIAKRTAFYLMLWGLAFVATQALAQLQNTALHAVGLLTMMLTLGVAAGSTTNLLLRQSVKRMRGAR